MKTAVVSVLKDTIRAVGDKVMQFYNRDWLGRVLCLVFLAVMLGCAWGAESVVTNVPPDAGTVDFKVFWPPRDPAENVAPAVRPLLNGSVVFWPERSLADGLVVHLHVVLKRPSDETGREFWNSRLAFPEHDWMRYVRVWDVEQKWLWPNLAYLLRLHGTERVERYGGVDPGKGVDNDFAAVLIRKYDVSGQKECADTTNAPLVAAEWYPVGVATANKQSIVHTVQSDEFTLHVRRDKQGPKGFAAVWLIYADFMGVKLPKAWPEAPEFAGGILAYFEVQWDLDAARGQEISVRQAVPRSSTGFDWESWALRTRAARDSKSTARLSDLAAGRSGSGKAVR